jgi:hypothetical protein
MSLLCSGIWFGGNYEDIHMSSFIFTRQSSVREFLKDIRIKVKE